MTMLSLQKIRQSKPITYAFVDAANIIYRNSDRNPWKIDLKKLIKYLRERFGATKILYYGGVDAENKAQLRIYSKLQSWGYELKLNPIKRFMNEAGGWYRKADIDARMAFEAMRFLNDYDRAIFLTGDGDFYWLLEYVLEKKQKVWLLSSPKKTAKELKRLFGSDFSNLDNLRSQIEYVLIQKEADSTNDSASGITKSV